MQNNHRWQLGDKVRKKSNSSWRGIVCGFYSTPHTPNGYSVVSLYEPGSVQVWPEAALEDWDGVMVEDELRAEIARLTEALCFIGKWVERGVFDAQISADEALEVIINLPGMPWNSDRWDVDHKPYAAAYYARFPAALKGPSHD